MILLALSATWMVAYAQQDSLRMDSVMHTLPEVMVRGERPIVKAEAGKLVFDLPQIIKDRAADNAFEALKELPGVIEQDGKLTLAGRPVTVIIDGKVTTMNTEQLNMLLKTIPAGRIRNAEVMYSAPARYEVHGQLINLNLQHNLADMLQGEAKVAGVQQHETVLTGQGSLLWKSGRWAVDASYQMNAGKSYHRMDDESHHSQSDGSVYDLNTVQQTRAHGTSHSYRVAADWQLADHHLLSLAYTGSYEPKRNTLNITGHVQSLSDYDGHNLMQNLRLDYETPFHLKVGADYTYYESPMTQWLESTLTDRKLNYTTESSQRINRWKLFAKQEHRLGGEWMLNYGASLTSSLDRSWQNYEVSVGNVPDNRSSRHRETIVNTYAGFSKNWGQRLSLDFSLAMEHYDNEAFREWVPFPNLTLQYRLSRPHLLQLSVSSSRTYPEYWAVQQMVAYSMGGYGEIVGNPDLRPSKTYEVRALWLLHSKYQLTGWFQRTDGYFVQTSYQRQDRLVMQYRHLNFDFEQQAGLMAYAPFSLFGGHHSTIQIIGVWTREKDSDFYDLPFDRQKVYGMINLNNTFALGKNLTAHVNGSYRTKAIQGIFDLPASGNLSLALIYKAMRQRLTVKLFGNDLLQTNGICPEMHFGTQQFRMGISYWRQIGVSLTYNFGNYQQKRHADVDVSRFRQ